MDWSKIGKILKSACDRDDDTAVLSRRDALAGLGLAGVFLVAGPKLLAPADARPLDGPATDAQTIAADTRAETDPGTPERDAADTADVTDLTSRRWRRRHWRRRYWRRRYWRRRYWRRRHWRRRYWRRRYWRRRYWY
jgi:hypothetical protein